MDVQIKKCLIKSTAFLRLQLLTYHDSQYVLLDKVKKGKAIPVTGHGDPEGCETLRVPHFLDNRLTDGGKVVSLTHRPPFTPQEDSWYSFLLEAESTPGS
jgi:hypothetical protein